MRHFMTGTVRCPQYMAESRIKATLGYDPASIEMRGLFRSVTKYHLDSYENDMGVDAEARFNFKRSIERLRRNVAFNKLVGLI